MVEFIRFFKRQSIGYLLIDKLIFQVVILMKLMRAVDNLAGSVFYLVV